VNVCININELLENQLLENQLLEKVEQKISFYVWLSASLSTFFKGGF